MANTCNFYTFYVCPNSRCIYLQWSSTTNSETTNTKFGSLQNPPHVTYLNLPICTPVLLYPQVNSEYFNHIYQTCKDLYNVHDVKSGYLKKKAFSWIWCYWVNIKYERKILKLFHNILILRKLLLKNRYQTLSRHP